MRYVLICLLGLCFSLAGQAAEGKKVLFFSSGHSKAKVDLISQLAQGKIIQFASLSNSRSLDKKVLEKAWSTADLVLLDGISPVLSKALFSSYQPMLKQYGNVPVVALGNIKDGTLNQGLNEKQRQAIDAYFANGGAENYKNGLLYIQNQVFELAHEAVEAPIIRPEIGLYHPGFAKQITDDSAAFFSWLAVGKNQPSIAIAIHRSAIDYQQSQIVDDLIAALEKQGAKAYAFFFEERNQALDYKKLLNGHVQLLINYRSMHYVDKRRQEFEQLGVPVIQAMNYAEGDEAAYLADNAGIAAGMMPFFLLLPEDAGAIDPVIIAAKKQDSYASIKAQVDALAARAVNHAKLSLMANKDKKIATFIWNYPPGEGNVGAAFLDVPESLEFIAKQLKDAGYQIKLKDGAALIEEVKKLLRPYYRNEPRSNLIDKNLADYLPLKDYQAWFNQLPEAVKKPIVDKWGAPEKDPHLVQKDGQLQFIIPRIDLGHMIIVPQGLRGVNAEEHSKNLHGGSAVNHEYLAAYFYVRKSFAANAIIHLGTHGSQEWLAGKERGLSVFDEPNLAVGNVPVFYPFMMDNVGEAMQTKRRGRATVISHLTPGFAKAELYGDVAKLAELISDYATLSEGQTKQNTQNSIIAQAKKLNLLKDLAIDETQLKQHFDDYVETLEEYLTELGKQSQRIPLANCQQKII